jgi:hypothetical protein
MGTHSNLGPIDPQFGSWPAIALIEEFERAKKEVSADPKAALVWQHILSKYSPTLLSHAESAIRWTREIGVRTLSKGMLRDHADPKAEAEKIVEFLASRDLHHAHGRHLHRQELRDCGLRITNLEDDPALQDAVLSVHHSVVQTLSGTGTVKLIENHCGGAWIKAIQAQLVGVPQTQKQPPVQPPLPPTPQPPSVTPAPNPAMPDFRTRLRLAIRILRGR